MAIDFDNLPFDEAIAALRKRVVLPRGLFDQLEAEGKARAFTAAGIGSMEVLTHIYQAALDAVTEGTSFREFAQRVPTTLEGRGWRSPNPWHALLVFGQQTRMAYGAGHYRQLVEAGADSWIFQTIDAACPLCSRLDGLRFGMQDRRWYPPIHYHCNCLASIGFEDIDAALADGAAIEQQLAAAPDTDAGGYYQRSFVQPANPFRWDPAEFGNVNPPDFSRYPAELRPMFAEVFGQAA